MSIEGQKFDRVEDATPTRLLRLAKAYRQAAELLYPAGQRKPALSFWPYRLLAIHSVELFLSAYLQANGIPPDVVRGMQHDLVKRTEQAVQAGLKLKQKTAEHLRDMTQNFEYRVARYEPEHQDKLSQLTRIQATLKEIADKVESSLRSKPVRAGAK